MLLYFSEICYNFMMVAAAFQALNANTFEPLSKNYCTYVHVFVY